MDVQEGLGDKCTGWVSSKSACEAGALKCLVGSLEGVDRFCYLSDLISNGVG